MVFQTKENLKFSMPSIYHSHPTGNQFFKNTALAFLETGHLRELWTCIAACDGNLWDKLSVLPGMGEIRRRSYPAELHSFLHLKPFREMARLGLNRTGWRNLTEASSVFSVDEVYQSLDRTVAQRIRKSPEKEQGVIYAYDDGALHSFEKAKERGWTTVFDLPIAYWETMEELLRGEAERYPEWAPTLLGDKIPLKKKERKTRELELADYFVCPSLFVARSLPEKWKDSDKVSVIPFGSPNGIAPDEIPEKKSSTPFRLLFVGGMSQRKGLADLFEAIKLLNSDKIELNILGDPMMGLPFYKNQGVNFKHHSTRDHQSVLNLMNTCDALVLPSIVEGRALVQQEAMAQGLPLIVTANAGAEDLIEEGITGHLVPIRNPQAIATAIDSLACRSSKELRQIKVACLEKVSTLSWESYRNSLVDLMSKIITS